MGFGTAYQLNSLEKLSFKALTGTLITGNFSVSINKARVLDRQIAVCMTIHSVLRI